MLKIKLNTSTEAGKGGQEEDIDVIQIYTVALLENQQNST